VISVELVRLRGSDGIFTHTLVVCGHWTLRDIGDVNQIIPVHVIVAALENWAASLTAIYEFDLHIRDNCRFIVFERNPLWIS